MKKFVFGFIIGAVIFGTLGVIAASYIANPVDFKVIVNGKEFVSDPPALEVEGRTYLPLRAIADALNVPVNWNEELRQAEVGIVTNTPVDNFTDGYDEFYKENGGVIPNFGYAIKRSPYSIEDKDGVKIYTYTLDGMIVSECKVIVNNYKLELVKNGFVYKDTDGIYEYYANSEKSIGVGISKSSDTGFFAVIFTN